MANETMWSPPAITVRDLAAWIKKQKIKHQDLADAIGISIHTLQTWLYRSERDTEVPKWMGCAIASCCAFSGHPGLFGIRLIDVNVALHLARGFQAAQKPKTQRSIADAKTIGYANQLTDRLLQVTAIETTNGPSEVRTDTESIQEGPDAEKASSTVR